MPNFIFAKLSLPPFLFFKLFQSKLKDALLSTAAQIGLLKPLTQ